MAKGDLWQVKQVSSLLIRTGAGVNNSAIGALYTGDRVTEEESQEVDGQLWIKHEKGWSCADYMKIVKEADSNVIDNTGEDEEEETEDDGVYRPDVDELFSLSNSSVDNSDFVNMKSIFGVLGLPYQFLPNTDPRLLDSEKSQNIGYEYANKIVAKMPLLFISPGKASFMTRYSTKEKKSVLERIIELFGDIANGESSLDDLLDKAGRYYTFEYDKTDYYNIVNPMCRIAARYLNIQDVSIDGNGTLDTMDWRNHTKRSIRAIQDIGDYNAVPFYVDSETSISESFSNSTAQSMLASSVNTVSDYARELRFLLGKDSGLDALQNDADVTKNMQNVQDMIGKLLGGNNFLGALAGHLTTVAAGGKLMLPEIWSDSSFARSYSCEFKFIAPDPSPLSVYLNVLVPLFHLMALVGPRSVPGNPNGYTNPFLVRACYKGFFNVDTGIITDMSVTRGAEAQWTINGVPTSITVSITIKDLYSAMAMTVTGTSLGDWKDSTVNNMALMDYIAGLCGINIFEPEIGRTIDMWLTNNFGNKIRDLPNNIWGKITDKIQNIVINDIYRR